VRFGNDYFVAEVAFSSVVYPENSTCKRLLTQNVRFCGRTADDLPIVLRFVVGMAESV
jgi:hypothetical protein